MLVPRSSDGLPVAQRKSAAVGVAGAMIKDGMVLLVHWFPASRINPDVCDLFGGHVDPGEHPANALRREAREELGIEVHKFRLLGSVYIATGPVVVHVYEVSCWNGRPVNAAPGEHVEVRWFGSGDLPLRQAWSIYGDLVLEAVDRSARQRGRRSSATESSPHQDIEVDRRPFLQEA